MRPQKVALLVAVLAMGSAIETAHAIREQIGTGPFGFLHLGGRFRGPAFTYEAEQSSAVPDGARSAIENSFGSVSVRPGPAGTVNVKLRKVVYFPDDARARAFADRLVVRTELRGDVLRITTNRAELERELEPVGVFKIGTTGFETHLSVLVPPGMDVEVQNQHGDVDVADVGSASISGAYGDVEVRAVAREAHVEWRHGDVKAARIAGGLTVDASYGDVAIEDATGAVRIAQAHGDVDAQRTGSLAITTQYGDVKAADVAGDLEVRGEHSAVEARGITGKADVESSYDGVELARIGGDARVMVEHGPVKVSEVKGAVTAETSFDDAVFEDISGLLSASVEHGAVRAGRIAAGAHLVADGDDVSLDGFKGAVEAEARRGGVVLTADGPLTGSVSAKSEFGNVTLSVSADSAFDLQAQSDSEALEMDLSDFTHSEMSERRVVGRKGAGGPLVKLVAQHGGVRVETK